MFEISSDDVALLNDEDLRTLVARLCEAALRSRGHSACCVTWGGNQNAADGGVDVRVALPTGTALDGFVPRAATGFQVKKSDMPPAKIVAEMRPDGLLRPAIRDLADRSGAYIIVSSSGSTSDTALQDRRAAMQEAVEDLPNAGDITLDFYDRTRLATWVRDHQGVALWVREIIGRSMPGWRSYGAWAYAPDGVNDQYLVDDTLRIRADATVSESELQSVAGIQLIRDRLRTPGNVVRLVGMSGVGKTRLVQALFDDRVGTQSLDPSLALYTDMGDSPDPQPTAVASNLIASRTPAILVVDNCHPDLHARLSQLCRVPESRVSLITVEYDIREDQPEGTDVFWVEPSSRDLIARLIAGRFPHLSYVNVQTIAASSDGNARIAIALAGTIGNDETVASLSDEALFQRLFHQRNVPNESLLLDAQALALVYSFEGEDVSQGDQAELFRLGGVIDKSASEMYRSAAELLRRNLIQRRGKMRAVLPPAIANRLAAEALENIPAETIEQWLFSDAPPRFVKSLARRLGNLDASPEARKIVTGWLAVGGWLGNVADLDALGKDVFDLIAPVAPEAVLSAFERSFRGPKGMEAARKCPPYLSILRSVAYDPPLFERSIALMVQIVEAQPTEKDAEHAAKPFPTLFPIHFSGTHATIDQRLGVVKPLVVSDKPRRRSLGLKALKAALATSNVSGTGFQFGARSRDFGYWPRTRDGVKQWYGKTLALAESLACADEPYAPEVRYEIAENFRGLWTLANVYDDLERVSRSISEKVFWIDGWLAVRQILFYDSKGLDPEVKARLSSLEASLQPKNLVQKVRSMVLPESVIYTGLDSTHDGTQGVDATLAQVEAMAYDLGKAVAADTASFSELLPDVVCGTSQQLWNFGRGLSQGSQEPEAIWNQLVREFAAAREDKANPHLLRCFLNGLHETNPTLFSTLLDAAVDDEVLAPWYPPLEASARIDHAGVARLKRSLTLEKASIRMYRGLVMSRVHQIAGEDFNALLLQIAEKSGGWDISIEILWMRLSSEDGRTQSSDSQLVSLGCELLRKINFQDRRAQALDFRVNEIVQRCLIGEVGEATVREICRSLKDSISRSDTYGFYQKELLQSLFRGHPLTALDALCGPNNENLKLGMRILEEAGEIQRRAFDPIPEAALLSWCDEQPENRYPAVAAGINALRPSSQSGRSEWTATARKLLDKAPDRREVLKTFIRQFRWSPDASQEATVESNLSLLDELAAYPDSALVEFAKKEKARLSEAVRTVREMKIPTARVWDERFE